MGAPLALPEPSLCVFSEICACSIIDHIAIAGRGVAWRVFSRDFCSIVSPTCLPQNSAFLAFLACVSVCGGNPEVEALFPRQCSTPSASPAFLFLLLHSYFHFLVLKLGSDKAPSFRPDLEQPGVCLNMHTHVHTPRHPAAQGSLLWICTTDSHGEGLASC